MPSSLATARINFRTDEQTKQSAEKLFAALGLDMSTALNMFLKQAIRDQALPIHPALHYVPNAQTEKALKHAQNILEGLETDDGISFDSAADAARFLDSLT